nr:MAG TPA: hypothetical protein [Caudoviricetes sp.]
MTRSSTIDYNDPERYTLNTTNPGVSHVNC